MVGYRAQGENRAPNWRNRAKIARALWHPTSASSPYSAQAASDGAGECLCELDRHRVSDLAHGLAADADELVLVREGLQASALADGEVTHTPVVQDHRSLAARHTV